MENKLICKPIMLEKYNPEDVVIFPVLARRTTKSGLKYTRERFGFEHVYLLSERKIECGDYCMDIRRGDVVRSSFGWKEDLWRTGGIYKIEATTDKSLGLPLIPQSFIEEYVAKQGKIQEVKVKSSMFNPTIVVTDNNTNCVIILPIKDNWNREEVKSIAQHAWLDGKANYLGGNFDEWFNKNY